MNSKEALKRIETMFPFNKEYKSNYYSQFSSSIEPFYKDFNLIKQDLEKLEKLEKENRKQLSTILDLDIENRTLKQAFEILKDKNVDIFELLKSKNLFDYNSLTWATYDFNGIELTEEEYNLLKEVLGND